MLNEQSPLTVEEEEIELQIQSIEMIMEIEEIIDKNGKIYGKTL
ncbi:hypothetical protein KNU91_gp046 [Enterococcus phage nattely]|uniref:Uncharacterized protein n=1 Tax=Enterococcus phage nattely TaxID=2719593 RepID=A0A6G9LKQ6_9CAUD|nr:hypothetical protein KNU91_gp046 [Enterococcus phage nattely]QIQ66213.1 hypothetical protein nattely_46 [Enterococcus phage nattely]